VRKTPVKKINMGDKTPINVQNKKIKKGETTPTPVKKKHSH
jgi:hypothetical protein